MSSFLSIFHHIPCHLHLFLLIHLTHMPLIHSMIYFLSPVLATPLLLLFMFSIELVQPLDRLNYYLPLLHRPIFCRQPLQIRKLLGDYNCAASYHLYLAYEQFLIALYSYTERQSQKHPPFPHWQAIMAEEFEALRKTHTWDPAPLSAGPCAMG